MGQQAGAWDGGRCVKPPVVSAEMERESALRREGVGADPAGMGAQCTGRWRGAGRCAGRTVSKVVCWAYNARRPWLHGWGQASQSL